MIVPTIFINLVFTERHEKQISLKALHFVWQVVTHHMHLRAQQSGESTAKVCEQT